MAEDLVSTFSDMIEAASFSSIPYFPLFPYDMLLEANVNEKARFIKAPSEGNWCC